ncbi:MAG: replicative DNA helicase [Ruminococcaceae bacterium]|nr:replicative DNA helicase [Oscillospiraceae bacterium]
MENGVPKVMPHNKEAEQSILGAMLIDADCVTLVFENLTNSDFYIEANKLIYESMQELFNRDMPIDLVTVSEELNLREQLAAVGGVEYLGYLASTLPTTANLRQYVDIVQDKAMLRRLIRASGEIMEMGYSPGGDTKNIADEAGRLIFDVLENQQQRGIVHIKDVLLQTNESLAEIYRNKGKLTGVPTGITELDKSLFGLQKSDFILIAARPSMGKTSFALNIATHAAVHGQVPVVIFSLEMSSVQLVSRIISSEMLIDSNHLRTGELTDDDWEKIAASLSTLGQAPIYINDSTNVTISDIRAKCRRLKLEKGLGLVVIDYLQLMQGTRSESRQQEISDISRSLKILAKELDVPIIALSQLSRAPEQRAEHRPMLSDLRESGAIEQDADIVMFLYRDDVYNPDTEKKNVAECIIAKHRAGSVGTIEMAWMGQFTRFMNLDKGHD